MSTLLKTVPTIRPPECSMTRHARLRAAREVLSDSTTMMTPSTNVEMIVASVIGKIGGESMMTWSNFWRKI